MNTPIRVYHGKRLDDVVKALESNNFEAFVVEDIAAAKNLVMDRIIPESGAKSFSWGGSMTLAGSGVVEAVKSLPQALVLDTFDKTISPEESYERRRQALLVDMFITGTNAVTESGMLVNLDMIGNRTGAIGFGPKNVIILVGRNKICADLDDAIRRIKDYAAPINAMRLDKKTPCVTTGRCQDCKSPDRICNMWAVAEKSFPKGRVKVVLINQDIGF